MHAIRGIQTIEELQKEIGKAKAESEVQNVKWLFRGQSRPYPKGWELLPAIYRRKTWLPEAGDDALAMEVCSKEREQKAFKDFMDAVMEKPSLVGKKKEDLPKEKLDWLALAQHHCLPTRLLDWTEEPRKALWFALWGNNEQPSVWMIPFHNEDVVYRDDEDRPMANPARGKRGGPEHVSDPFSVRGTTKRTLLFQPKAGLDERIEAQNGWLALFPDRNEGEEGPQTPLERNGRYKNDAVCFRIDPVMRRELQRELIARQPKIDQSTLFPDADGLAMQLGLQLQLDVKNRAASGENET